MKTKPTCITGCLSSLIVIAGVMGAVYAYAYFITRTWDEVIIPMIQLQTITVIDSSMFVVCLILMLLLIRICLRGKVPSSD